jgi:alpha-methylacyl-CoA racemase
LLKGLRVLDLSRHFPGPVCAHYLAELGAEVIKIEDDDYLRSFPVLYKQVNSSKKILKLNLKDEKNREQFLKLVKKSQVVIESFRPGVMKKLKLDFKVLKKANSKIILCSLTGYGQKGARSQEVGHDLNYLAYAGVLSQIGESGKAPAVPGFPIADLTGAVTAALAIVSARLAKKSCHIDISLMESALSLNLMLLEGKTRGEGILNGGTPCYSVYETKDGQYMALAALEKKFWLKFLELAGKGELRDFHLAFGEKADFVRRELTELFKTKTRDEWQQIFAGQETCCTPVLEPHEVPLKKGKLPSPFRF